MKTIEIVTSSLQTDDCVSVILVPEKALQEPGYISTMGVGLESQAKHEYFAMAQMAYYRFQDDELEIVVQHSPIEVRLEDKVEVLTSGMIIYRDSKGELHVLLHGSLNPKKMLETTNRYCTRWVRLDI